MRINEIFYSIQGEGVEIGKPMIFIRVSGCNLRCNWCDTKYAYTDGNETSIENILKKIKNYQCTRVCITGGEPLLQNDLNLLIGELLKNGYEVSIETNGSIQIDILDDLENVKISMDLKCPSSGESEKMMLNNVQLLMEKDQLKFVIYDDVDYEYARNVILNITSPPFEVIFTPCDIDEKDNKIELKILTEKVLNDHLNVRVLPQLHKIIWPDIESGI